MPKRGTINAVIALLGLAAFTIASCVGDLPPAGKGHEETRWPTAVFNPAVGAVRDTEARPPLLRAPKPQGKPASRQAELSALSADGSCQSPADALHSVVKTAPDASVTTHLEGRTAAGFIAQFRASTGADVDGDEVMLIQSANYGEAKVAVFAKNHCVQRTLAYQPSTPNHDQ